MARVPSPQTRNPNALAWVGGTEPVVELRVALIFLLSNDDNGAAPELAESLRLL